MHWSIVSFQTRDKVIIIRDSRKYLPKRFAKFSIIEGIDHSFTEYEKEVISEMKEFIRSI